MHDKEEHGDAVRRWLNAEWTSRGKGEERRRAKQERDDEDDEDDEDPDNPFNVNSMQVITPRGKCRRTGRVSCRGTTAKISHTHKSQARRTAATAVFSYAGMHTHSS